MIKIRLHGEPSEIETAINAIEQNFEILSKSGMYADRGASKYSRVYLDCKFLEIGIEERAYKIIVCDKNRKLVEGFETDTFKIETDDLITDNSFYDEI